MCAFQQGLSRTVLSNTEAIVVRFIVDESMLIAFHSLLSLLSQRSLVDAGLLKNIPFYENILF